MIFSAWGFRRHLDRQVNDYSVAVQMQKKLERRQARERQQSGNPTYSQETPQTGSKTKP